MIESGLAATLAAHGGLAALIDDRVYPLVIPQGAPSVVRQPCVVYQLVSRVRQGTYCGQDGTVQAQYQLDAYARSYLEAKQVAEQVQGALIDFRGQMGEHFVHHISLVSEIDLHDPEPGLYRVNMTFSIWHGPPSS